MGCILCAQMCTAVHIHKGKHPLSGWELQTLPSVREGRLYKQQSELTTDRLLGVHVSPAQLQLGGSSGSRRAVVPQSVRRNSSWWTIQIMGDPEYKKSLRQMEDT